VPLDACLYEIDFNLCRTHFESNQLVYNPADNSWHGPSKCVWAENQIQLPGKVSLATWYKDHQSFFCVMLGVQKPNLAMHISALRNKVLDTPTTTEVMQEMLNICALNPSVQSLKTLADCKCLPVRLTSGEIQWMASSEDFAIVDRREWGEKFENKIKLLDFSLEQVHRLSPFLHGLNLGHRYLSKMVKVDTNVEGGSLHQKLTHDLRAKAYAIAR
jgi:hypothetical protein